MYIYSERFIYIYTCVCVYIHPHVYRYIYTYIHDIVADSLPRCVVETRGGGLGSSTIFKNLMSPTPRRKWYLTTGRRAH